MKNDIYIMPKSFDILVTTPVHGSPESYKNIGVALACIGARYNTWQLMMNFLDCDITGEYELNVGNHVPSDGCWKNYDSSPPTAYRDIINYIKEYHKNPDRFKDGITRHKGKDVWGTDQAMIATRIAQYVIAT